MNAIELEGLTKRYKKGVVAVEDTSFTVPQGTAFGLLGPIGAGKSSIINMLLQFHFSPALERSRYLIARSPHSFTRCNRGSVTCLSAQASTATSLQKITSDSLPISRTCVKSAKRRSRSCLS